ncbi:MAG: acyl-CoA-binding protein [Roseivirga sp.]|nr:acyl-CoA-binding protein [Roseivirga sp.]
MELAEAFQKAVKQVDTLTQKPSNSVLLKAYALYKQATQGDNNNERPGGFDFKAIAKHNAWLEEKGQTADEAMTAYIDLINGLVAAES